MLDVNYFIYCFSDVEVVLSLKEAFRIFLQHRIVQNVMDKEVDELGS